MFPRSNSSKKNMVKNPSKNLVNIGLNGAQAGVPKTWIITIPSKDEQEQYIYIDAILELVQPSEFIPFMVFPFEQTGFSSFLVKNCEEALDKLSESSYAVKYQQESFRAVKSSPSSAQLQQHQHPDMLTVLRAELQKRMDTTTNTLNLNNFSADFLSSHRLYLPLWYSGNQALIATRLWSLKFNPVSLHLSNNKIKSLTSFMMTSTFRSVSSVHLDNNCLSKLGDLVCLKGLNIREIWLNDNNFRPSNMSSSENIKALKTLFPLLTQVDGHFFHSLELVPHKRNYAVDLEAVQLVNKFLETYYRLLDSEDRGLLVPLYHKGALFSLTSHIPNSSPFNRKSRNLLEMGRLDKSSAYMNLFTGPKSISGCLCCLPRTEHDPFSFTVDIPLYNEYYVMLVITGVFKVPSDNLSEDEPLSEFQRSFLLGRDQQHCYRILNDMWNISPHTTSLSQEAFKFTVACKNKLSLVPQKELTSYAKTQFINYFMEITNLSQKTVEMCLEKRKWNFQAALKDAITILEKN